MPDGFGARIAAIADHHITQFVVEMGFHRPGSIAREMGFRAWCQMLGDKGLRVDGHPFTLHNRPAMHHIYDLIPTTPEEAFGRTVVMQKCAQVGFTVMEMLAVLYMAIKFEPATIGMYLPDMKLAQLKSSERFMPIVRLVPDAHARLVGADRDGGKRTAGEGNVMARRFALSLVLFLWTTGRATTESMPMDILSFDEVQEMLLADMEKTKERLSASRIRFTLMGSTANWPDSDINWWFKRGTQHRFRTRCPSCEGWQIMDDHFPPPPGGKSCIGYDEERRDWRYACVHCGGWIDDPQAGEWVAENPDALTADGRGIESVHFPQFLSPTITPREMVESYNNATNLKNWYNRKAGKPFTDPSQVPVNLEHLNAACAAGVRAGVVWKKSARQTFLGIDNMGGFACAIVMERMPNGMPALIHAEQVHGLNPWARLDEIMRDYGVAVAVCEQLPNYDSAKQFAHRWPGKVFLVAAYTNIEDDMMRWGDAHLSRADRRTGAEFRDQHTVTLDQYKMMSWSLARIVNGTIFFPEANGLSQDIIINGVTKHVALLREVLFDHFTRTALVTEQDEEEHKVKRFVRKIGIDPHFSFALMLCFAAWCRANGTSSFMLPDTPAATPMVELVERAMPGLPAGVMSMLAEAPDGVCGSCAAFANGECTERGLRVGARDPSCMLYVHIGPRGA